MLLPAGEYVPGAYAFYAELALYLVPYLVIGYDVLFKAARNIGHGQVFDENFLMCIATVGAFCIGQYPEAVAVMLFTRWASCSRPMPWAARAAPLRR